MSEAFDGRIFALEWQTDKLNLFFENKQSATISDLEYLSKKTELPPKGIYTWFNNKRVRTKRNAKKRDSESTTEPLDFPIMYNSLHKNVSTQLLQQNTGIMNPNRSIFQRLKSSMPHQKVDGTLLPQEDQSSPFPIPNWNSMSQDYTTNLIPLLKLPVFLPYFAVSMKSLPLCLITKYLEHATENMFSDKQVATNQLQNFHATETTQNGFIKDGETLVNERTTAAV